jgi:hypothetical protein
MGRKSPRTVGEKTETQRFEKRPEGRKVRLNALKQT